MKTPSKIVLAPKSPILNGNDFLAGKLTSARLQLITQWHPTFPLIITDFDFWTKIYQIFDCDFSEFLSNFVVQGLIFKKIKGSCLMIMYHRHNQSTKFG